ncbi:porin [Limnohabitans sp.]|uniref:porin n=1 Tax=Limnohabitans sp. TaxID=1907725 RepID=UPI0025C7161D|nr:porin [Limnohabitans sp.]
MATLAATGVYAQSSVQIYGVVDARINSIKTNDNGTLTRLDGSGAASSRLGFRGTEDLGGGLKAKFVLEMGMNNDTGAGQNTTANNTNMGQNLSAGSGSWKAGQAVNASTYRTQGSTPSSSGLGGLQGLTFGRQAFVGLEGGFGEVRLGRDYAPTFWNLSVYDPFGTNGVGQSHNISLGTMHPVGAFIAPPGSAAPGVRSSNAINYFTPTMNGFQANAMYGFSEQRTNCLGVNTVGATDSAANGCDAQKGDGEYIGIRLMYNQGPLSLSVATGKTKYANKLTAEARAIMVQGVGINNGPDQIGNVPFMGDYSAMNIGASYDFGVAKAMFQYGEQKRAAYTNTGYAADGLSIVDTAVVAQTLKHTGLGVAVPMGATTLKASYNWGSRNSTTAGAADLKANQLAVGANYALSKRTQLYATYSTLTAKNGATAALATVSNASSTTQSKKSSGYDIGLAHSF